MFTMKAYYFTKAFLVALFLAIPSLSAQNTVIFDDFTDSSYSVSSRNGFDFGSNPADLSFASSDIAIIGGASGSVLNVFHEHDVDRDESGDPLGDSFVDIQSFFDNSALTYTPSTQGSIQSINFSLDVRTFDPIDTLFFNVSDSNGSAVPIGEEGVRFLSVVTNGEWQTISLSGVTEASGRDFAGSNPLDFGFGFLSSADVFDQPETFLLEADNFRIDINPIPEPSSALLIALGLAGLTRRRR